MTGEKAGPTAREIYVFVNHTKFGAGEGNRTLVISLEEGCLCNLLIYNDYFAFALPKGHAIDCIRGKCLIPTAPVSHTDERTGSLAPLSIWTRWWAAIFTMGLASLEASVEQTV